MNDKETIIYKDYSDLDLIEYIINNMISKSDKIVLDQFMQCGFNKALLSRRLKSSKYIVDKEINRIYFLISQCFKKIKNN